jgi:hypothetical protein
MRFNMISAVTPARLRSMLFVALFAAGAALVLSGGAVPGYALTETVIYNSVPQPLPPNLPSLGYQATSTQEFGDNIAFAGTNRRVTKVTVTMSDWALHSDYPSMDAAGWTHPITLNLYTVDHSGPNPARGSLITTVTQTFGIPWRPEADPTCPGGGTAWRAGDGLCYNGLAFNITFDLSSLNVILPNEIIYGIAYNTETHGYTPIGAPGPYNSLNVGLNDLPPTTGTDVEEDALFWNTSFAGFYTDGGAGGVSIFRRDTAWTPYTPTIQFKATEVPVAPPTNKDQCKNGGWQSFNNPSFKNQGDCVSYTNNGK